MGRDADVDGGSGSAEDTMSSDSAISVPLPGDTINTVSGAAEGTELTLSCESSNPAFIDAGSAVDDGTGLGAPNPHSEVSLA